MDESEVGILCYISQLPGFRGILKQRYSDFIVNEVDLDGNVVHLTSLTAPPESVEVRDGNETKKNDYLNKSYDSEVESFRALAGEADADLLKTLIDQVTSGPKENISAIVLSPNSDKTQRTAIHNYFKENFKFLVTDTIDGPDASSKSIRVRLYSGGEGNGRNSRKRKERGDKPFDSRGSSSWPENVGKFLRFNLYKENKDTQEALGIVGKMLGVQSKSFGFAGTKDKRAVTTQRVTVFKQSASKLASLNERLIGIKVGDFCYVKDGLLLGQLQGNRFTVTLRGVLAELEDNIKASADSLGKHGFINYFGLQRFGSGSIPTHLIGAALLRGEWKAAIQRDVIAMAREYYKKSGDIEGTLRQLPRHLVAERALLQSLKKSPGNYLQALRAIPRTLRMMYVHSYQSYLWNHAASLRVQKYGSDQVMVGDLVFCRREAAENAGTAIDLECGADNNFVNDSEDLDEASETDVSTEQNVLVKALALEDIASHSYTVDDIILPMPGSRVIYPNNDIAEVYNDLAKKDGISLAGSPHNIKEFSITSLTGGYRRVFQKPTDFQWELLKYTDAHVPLAETDLDRITKAEPLNMADENDSAANNNSVQVDDEKGVNVSPSSTEAEGTESLDSHVALKLSFTLPASSYATMAIRELLKTSTSVAYHKTLNEKIGL
ncbi:hypothetical protein CRG98_032437 [Punica granatum]|uniref:TRUD domain-containing protein n=1 Tax=Punica granatum TaxID=22663 RepID=A0A2I0IUR6_PUNGR|nr:hypothetical protein CRG98_032437 [Punica granatum]